MHIRLPRKWEPAIASSIACPVIDVIARTMQIAAHNGCEVERRLTSGEGQILVTWHGRTLVPLCFFRGRSVVTIVSPSRDGEIQYRIYRRYGWDAVRGSTRRGGVQAALGAIRRLKAGATLGLAPDGPLGPARVVQPGTLYLAAKSGCPIIPVGASASRAWQLGSWDSFQLPGPFTRGAMVFGEPIYVGAHCAPETLRRMARDLGATLDILQADAEALARQGALTTAPAEPSR